jgi:hypothetical protein
VQALKVIASLLAALASLPYTSTLGTDATLPRHERPGGVSLARRKDPSPPAEIEPLVTHGTLLNLHTGEAAPISPTEPTPEQFSDLCADKALLGRIEMAPRLLDALRALAAAHPGVRVDVVSGYRSPKRNEMMRKKGRRVASHSQHTLGQAVDFRVEGLGVPELVKAVEAMKWKGGVGRYDGKSDLFVHLDVGPDRRWKGK